MNYVYINKENNIVESVITGVNIDVNSNLQPNQYFLQLEILDIDLMKYKYKYENGKFTVVGNIPQNVGVNLADRVSVIEDMFIKLMEVL